MRNEVGLVDVLARCGEGIFRAAQTQGGVFQPWYPVQQSCDKRGTVVREEPSGVAVFIAGEEGHSMAASALPNWKRVL